MSTLQASPVDARFAAIQARFAAISDGPRATAKWPSIEVVALLAIGALALGAWSFDHKQKALSESGYAAWPSCHVAHSFGATPILRWEAGYSAQLDGDGDGVACEPARWKRVPDRTSGWR